MLEALLVTFREGIESFLILGILVAYLKKTDRAGLVKGVRIGLALSVVTCAAGAWLWLQVPNQPLYEGIAALATAGRRGRAAGPDAARRPPHQGPDRERASAAWRARGRAALAARARRRRAGDDAAGDARGAGGGALPGRAGAGRTRPADSSGGAAAGRRACSGFVAAGFFAWSWTRWGHRLNLGVILKVTSLFLGLFLIQLARLRHPRAGRERRHPRQPGVPRRHRAVRPRRAASATWLSYSLRAARRCSTCCSPACRSRARAPPPPGQRVGRRRA